MLKRQEFLDRICWELTLVKMLFKMVQNDHKKSQTEVGKSVAFNDLISVPKERTVPEHSLVSPVLTLPPWVVPVECQHWGHRLLQLHQILSLSGSEHRGLVHEG